MTETTSTLLIATKTPRTCNECRHANHGTVDFREGRLLCWIARTPKRSGQRCDVSFELWATRDGPTSSYFLFEPFDGGNETFEHTKNFRVLAEDADDEMRADFGLPPACPENA